MRDLVPQGAQLSSAGVHYRVWAPVCRQLDVEIYTGGRVTRTLPMLRDENGYFQTMDERGRAGDRYKFRLNGQHTFPDPASRFQPDGVHQASMVVDSSRFPWTDSEWRVPSFRDLTIYELHIGTFTPAGTFRGAIERLPHLVELGITAIEILPIGDFPGRWNWGYDGVYLFAPARAYGQPDDLRALVDTAHRHGLAVILDVVYNHFGPDGNYLAAFIGHYLDEAKKTPWGGAIRYASPEFKPLRSLVVSNPGYWAREFHIDGFRLDATHAIVDDSPRHILAELTAAIHAVGRFAIAEDSRNDTRVLTPEQEGGLGFDGVWADDFHHTTRVANTHENESYLADFEGSIDEIVETLNHGWLFRGQYAQSKRRNRGSECRHLAPEHFVFCTSNHDQVGNRAMGDRVGAIISREAFLATTALLCLSPYLPMLFMGQEWMADTPFLFFTDHHAELGKLVTKGRREEFKEFAAFKHGHDVDEIPDPQAEKTFLASKLNWAELQDPRKQSTLELVKVCLGLRNRYRAFRPKNRDAFQAVKLGSGIGALRFRDPGGDWLLLFDLAGGHSASLESDPCSCPGPKREWQSVLSTSEQRFGGSGRLGVEFARGAVHCPVPEAILLREL